MIAIIDYGAGNLRSVEKAFLYLGCNVTVTTDTDKILSADRVILPGVGSFADCMNSIKTKKFDSVIRRVIKDGKPFLGICLGMQMMYKHSTEGDTPGFGLLEGRVLRFPDKMGLKIPQIGWNSLNILKPSALLNGIGENPFVYFVHSYYVNADDMSTVVATTDYGVTPHVLVESDNLYLTQFHPEKSGKTGLKILDNFAKLKV